MVHDVPVYPVTQLLQSDALVLPVPDVVLCPSQLVHVVALLAADLYVPAVHAVQLEPFRRYPALHTQSFALVAPVLNVVLFVPHVVHWALPVADLYVPVAHASHAVPALFSV